MDNKKTIIETITLKNGMRIDKDDAWLKLTQRQFGGTPGRGFGELVQNGYDGYDNSIDWVDRKLIIHTTKNSISIIDFGEGMSREKLKLLVTLGGTDKANDINKIGQFGIGFCSMFNPDLGTKKVTVHTMCEGHAVELVFIVVTPGKIPIIKTKMLSKTLRFSTKIMVEFDNRNAAKRCLNYAEESLKTFPCTVRINDKPFKSIWENAKDKGYEIFQSGQCMGFIEPGGSWSGGTLVRLLRRYEQIMPLSIEALVTGGHGLKMDLRDWSRKKTPYVENITLVINCNNLNVPISRDGFYLDSAYHSMIRVINAQLMKHLETALESTPSGGLIMANQYILVDKIKEYLNLKAEKKDTSQIEPAIKILAKAKTYKINGRSKRYSLMDISEQRTKELPVFYSPQRNNLRWLGGAFKHDFIILPPWMPNMDMQSYPSDFFEKIFNTLFSDIVNLDEIEYDHEKMADLVQREIIDKGSLSPDVAIVEKRELSKKEIYCIEKIDQVLAHESIKKAIAKNLNLQISKINSVFFNIQNSGGVISTGFFDENGTPLVEDAYTNFTENDDKDESKPCESKTRQILLGLQRDNVFIDALINADDKYIAQYMLIYLTHELAMCQKLLVPYSPYFHVVKSRLAKDMRQAMIEQILSCENENRLKKTI